MGSNLQSLLKPSWGSGANVGDEAEEAGGAQIIKGLCCQTEEWT